MELRIVKPSFKYTAGQWLFVQVPDISRWQWHPVSIVGSQPVVRVLNGHLVHHHICSGGPIHFHPHPSGR